MRGAAGSPHPDIPGFAPVRWLGGGGYADVFLYQQHRPNREVAVKVLRQTVFDPRVRRQFEAEADLMAAVSEHPHIVSIYAADIAPDGRPYLVMEYYRQGEYQTRARKGLVSVEEAIGVGVQVAGAVETAHREGTYHNDLKPANILISDFDHRPGLTDFGISVATDRSHSGPVGASLPFTAPEIIEADTSGSPAADVFALGATIYALLTGHSPFERPGAREHPAAIMRRVMKEDPPPLRRADVPPDLEQLLRHAMDKDPDRRPQSAYAFGLSLKGVERQLGVSPTTMVLRDRHIVDLADEAADGPVVVADLDDELTRHRPITIRAQVDARAASSDDAAVGTPGRHEVPIAPRLEGAPSPVADTSDTVARAVRLASPAPEAAPELPARGRVRSARLVAAVFVLAVAAFAGYVAFFGDRRAPTSGTDDDASVADVPEALNPLLPPVEIVARVLGEAEVEVTWRAPSRGEVDEYRVYRIDAAGSDTPEARSSETSVLLVAQDEPHAACFRVHSVRDGRLSAPAATTCVSGEDPG